MDRRTVFSVSNVTLFLSLSLFPPLSLSLFPVLRHLADVLRSSRFVHVVRFISGPFRLPRDNLQRGRRYCMSDAACVSFSGSCGFCSSRVLPLPRRRWRREEPLCKIAAEDILVALHRSISVLSSRRRRRLRFARCPPIADRVKGGGGGR